jgi:hypothetical protein
MLLVNEALEKKNLAVRDLPTDLQFKVRELDTMLENFNEAWDEYDDAVKEDESLKSEETEARLNRIEKDIQEEDESLSKSILEFTPAPAAPATPPAPADNKKNATGEGTKKKGGGFGVFIAIVAAVGLAAIGIKNARK